MRIVRPPVAGSTVFSQACAKLIKANKHTGGAIPLLIGFRMRCVSMCI